MFKPMFKKKSKSAELTDADKAALARRVATATVAIDGHNDDIIKRREERREAATKLGVGDFLVWLDGKPYMLRIKDYKHIFNPDGSVHAYDTEFSPEVELAPLSQ